MLRTCYVYGFALAAIVLLYAPRAFAVEPAAPNLTKEGRESEALVGIAKIDVTPDYPVRLNGFGGRRTESEGVTQKIWVKAIAIGDNAKTAAVLLTVDNLGVPDWMTRQVGTRLHDKTGLDPKRLTITYTHSHTTPMLRGTCPTIFGHPIPPEHQKNIDRYTEQMAGWLEEAATKALAAREKSRLAWTVGKVTFAVNRRNRGGPVDHDLPVLVISDQSGKPRAIYTSYACHCVTFGHNKISGDWAGYAAEAIEANHPGVVALISIGCGADSNPNSGVTSGDIAAATAQGRMIGDEVRRLLGTTLRPVKGTVEVRSDRIDLPLQAAPGREYWQERAKSTSHHVAHHARTQLERLDRGEKLKSAVDYPIQTWTFGDDLAMVFLAGEVVVDYSLRLKRELDGDRVWIHGYTNDFPFYIPSERVLKEGGYEGGDSLLYFDMPAKFAPGVEKKILDVVHRQVPAAFKSRHDANKTGGTFPLSPERSLAAIRTRPEMVVELVAAEPLVVDPVAIDFGADGRLWVAEMHDYPQGIDGRFKPGGRIKVLSDENGDGRFDQATTFLDNVPFPTGVTVWGDGVLVCAAPDVLYARDENRDGRADSVTKLLTGFATHNYQGRVNSIQLGLDNWLYAASGLFGGKIEGFRGNKLDLTSRDFRFRAESGETEPVTGQSQQSRVRDDWGNWFGCDSGTVIRHYPVVDRYVRRNPEVAPPATAVNVANYPDANRLYPASSQLVTFKLSGPPGHVTAACGLCIYRDELLGEEYHGNAFTCEPVVQAVHRLVLSPRGSTFSGRRAAGEERSEFLASTDNWFRPVQARTGPDGALWIVDMYRYVIEHPIWIPPDVLAALDVRAGERMGRIYRVYHRDRPPRPMPKGRVEMDSPNGTVRDLAQQMFIAPSVKPGEPPGSSRRSSAARNDEAAVEALRTLARKSRWPQVRLQALATLDGMGEGILTVDLVRASLRDPHPGVRRHAVRLAERWVRSSPELVKQLSEMTNDADAQVRLQLAYTLGECPGEVAVEALVKLALKDFADPYLCAAVLSSLNKQNVGRFVERLVAVDESPAQVVEALTSTDLATSDKSWWWLALSITDVDPEKAAPWRFLALARLLEKRDRLPRSVPGADVGSFNQILAFCRDADEIVENRKADVAKRVAIIRMLGLQGVRPSAHHGPLLSALVSPHEPPAIQLAAINQIFRIDKKTAPVWLLSKWVMYSPDVRRAVLDGLLSRNDGIPALLDGIEKGQISPGEIDAARRQRLLESKDSVQQDRAKRLLAAGPEGDRNQLVQRYAAALSGRGDEHRGRELFAKTCAACHRLKGAGHELGPDLAAMAGKPPQALLVAILDPNQAVDPRYQNYTVLATTGESASGVLTAETATSITLAAQEGRRHVLLRSEIDEIRSTKKSFMPEGLERDISPEQMRDLLEYLAGSGSPPKVFAGNRPRIIHPRADGVAILAAADGEIRGPTLVFEPEFRNLGFWSSQDDYVMWTLETHKAGRYDVVLDYACDDGAAGNRFVIELGGTSLRGQIAGTGGWSRYRQAKVGTVELTSGTHSVVLRGDGPIRGALIDLRALRLMPPGMFVAHSGDSTSAIDLAATLLDDKKPARERSRLIADHPHRAAELIAAMAAGLPVDAKDNREEYRRIPWIWQVAIAAGRRNDAKQLKSLLAVSLPKSGEPLRDWQAVVIGGGIINGITQAGTWPGERVAEILKEDAELSARWKQALDAAAPMTDDEKVPTGTRYDALRMLGVDSWDRRGGQIARYLAKGTHDELQMGAVSALGDMRGDQAAQALLDSMANLSKSNRNLALDALVRDARRIAALLDAIESGKIPPDFFDAARVKRLKEHADENLRQRAARLLK